MTEVVSVRQKKPLGLRSRGALRAGFGWRRAFAVMLADDLIDADVPGIRASWSIFSKRPPNP